ncbi:methyltransferase domain-containing protein [Desulfonatronospira sp.]|uniref:methyltransferase domain-containing protein n=1 Tax=Desulfonatronospira sp. TaxID=1962951 RepID=UPI0025B9BE18|nr:methyltransferase domain-containing protein [Desulfonatronospira sp.]
MKTWLTQILICPACLPLEKDLRLKADTQLNDDVLDGSLSCPECLNKYPIREGIAMVHPHLQTLKDSGSKYENSSVVSSYLWSHYCDLLNDPEGSSAYQDWAGLMHSGTGGCLDMGSAVGRFTFDMASRFDFALGIDDSVAFIRAARKLMTRRRIAVELIQEGILTRKETLTIPLHWQTQNVEFIVADAMALPFASGAFSALASLNMVDKLPLPLKHLQEAGRLAHREKAQFLLSDPFSWSKQCAEREHWLGGKSEGEFAGYGLDNIAGWLELPRANPGPGWNIEKKGHVWWKSRTHRNHYELIRSCYVKAFR